MIDFILIDTYVKINVYFFNVYFSSTSTSIFGSILISTLKLKIERWLE